TWVCRAVANRWIRSDDAIDAEGSVQRTVTVVAGQPETWSNSACSNDFPIGLEAHCGDPVEGVQGCCHSPLSAERRVQGTVFVVADEPKVEVVKPNFRTEERTRRDDSPIGLDR